MKSCLDPDTLTSIGQALDWDVAQLDHVHGCTECRAQLEELAGARAHLSHEEPVRPGFADGVMAAIEERAASRHRSKEWLVWLNPALAAMAAVAVAMAARPAPWALVASAFVASVIVFWRERVGVSEAEV